MCHSFSIAGRQVGIAPHDLLRYNTADYQGISVSVSVREIERSCKFTGKIRAVFESVRESKSVSVCECERERERECECG